MIALFCVFVHEVRLPATAFGIACPYFGLVRVAARLFALNVGCISGNVEALDLRFDCFRRIDHYPKVLAERRVRIFVEVKREFEAGLFRNEQRVIIQLFRRLRTEQRGVEGNARVEIARGNIEMHFHTSAFSGMRALSDASMRIFALAARR